MAKTPFHTRIITPEGTVFDGEVLSLRLPGHDGEFGVLARHAPLLSALSMGSAVYETPDGLAHQFLVGEGFAEVGKRGVDVLVDFAEKPGEIDVGRAEKALQRARERLEAGKVATTDVDYLRAESAMRRALVRLKLAKQPRL